MVYAPPWPVASGWTPAAPRNDVRFTTGIADRTAGIGAIDLALICLFLLGLYTNYTIYLSAKVPFPSAPSGVAGVILLWRRRDRVTPHAFGTLVCVLFLYVLSILCAPNLAFLPRRLNGLIQLTYSIVIGYALFLTVTMARREQMTRLFLGLSLFIAIGCLLETYGGLRPVSDAVRQAIYSRGVYENDLRDVLLYHRVRPKFFASEPASVTFCYTLFTFVWFVASRWRYKLPVCLAMVALGVAAMPGPTLLLLLVLILPYMLFVASRRNGRLDVGRLFRVGILSLFFLAAFFVLAQTLFHERFQQAASGNDPSFFYRVRGPAIAAREIVRDFPLQGAGLTGEPFIEERVVNIYVRSPAYSVGWAVVSPATELLINYFWLHWIYLGAGFGTVILLAVSRWLFVIGVPSAAFCWMSWAILGQASGAYVGPTCWAVLLLCGAAAVLHERDADAPAVPSSPVATPVPDLLTRLDNLRHRAGTEPRAALPDQERDERVPSVTSST